MQRLAPLLSKISDTVMARSGKLHAVATTPSRRTAAMPPSKLTPSSLSQSGMSPLDPPPPASTKKRGGGGDAFSPPKPTGGSKKKTVEKPVVIPSSSLVIPPAPPTSQRAKALQSAIPALLNPSDLQSAFNNSSSLLQLPKVNPASSVRPGGGGAGGLASHVSAGTLSEGQLTLHIDRLQRVIAIAYQPLRPTIQRLISLERQADELARQLRVAQAQEKRTREAEGDGAPFPALQQC
ncbi:unnamed protein product [Bodo saltans]|uniref:Uncharacterized protein n=1 Tax=Bodo saltans TaxID=75058 RepID=A0A0S4KPY2_BODSA|nr:unnamed protein product [Bodo saltans]|eukprot:CUI14985.1 unnamed protein product [Bodo saltans]